MGLASRIQAPALMVSTQSGRMVGLLNMDAKTTNQRTELIGPSRAYYSNYSFLLAVLGVVDPYPSTMKDSASYGKTYSQVPLFIRYAWAW